MSQAYSPPVMTLLKVFSGIKSIFEFFIFDKRSNKLILISASSYVAILSHSKDRLLLTEIEATAAKS